MNTDQQKPKSKNKILTVVIIICLSAVLIVGTLIVAMLLSKNKNMEPEVELIDEATLRQFFLSDGTAELVLTNDVNVKEQLIVKGTKTLKGEKTIKMDLSNIGKDQSVLSVEEGAVLILDGATLDGNGVAMGINVDQGGKLESVCGSVIWGYPYGLNILGEADIKDITVDKALHTSVYINRGGKLNMQGGELKNSIFAHIATSKGTETVIGGDVKVHDTNAYIIYNYGKMDITGGEYYASNKDAVTNYGVLSIKGTEENPVEFYDLNEIGIKNTQTSSLEVDHVYIHDVKKQGIYFEQRSTGSVKNTELKKTEKSSIYVDNSDVTCEDITISNSNSYGFYVCNGANASVDGIAIKKVSEYGFGNDSSKLTIKDATVTDAARSDFYSKGNATTTLDGKKV